MENNFEEGQGSQRAVVPMMMMMMMMMKPHADNRFKRRVGFDLAIKVFRAVQGRGRPCSHSVW
jgi:hypothetical protein